MDVWLDTAIRGVTILFSGAAIIAFVWWVTQIHDRPRPTDRDDAMRP